MSLLILISSEYDVSNYQNTTLLQLENGKNTDRKVATTERLQDLFEIVGILKDIERIDGNLVLTFEMQKEIVIQFIDNTEEELIKLKGSKIGILYIYGRYKIRKLEGV